MKFAKTRDVKTPNRGTKKSAGIDFFIPNDHPNIRLLPHEAISIPSGIKVRIPENKLLIVRNKSGIAIKNQLVVGADIIDEDYTGEMHLHVINTSKETVFLKPGQKLVQMLLIDANYETMEEVSEAELFLGFETERGEGMAGSTGLF